MSHIYWALDPPSKEEDESCRVGYSYNDDGEIIIEEIEYKPKEVKKVKKEIDLKKMKYFELKVVKVKKVVEKKQGECKEYNPKWCGKCPRIPKPKGNWVNGENLDKIKFPCFCSYSNDKEKGIGFLSVDKGYYYIANINFQKKNQEDIKNSLGNLKAFITNNNIHIRKGKIIIFEEEE